MKLRTFHLPQCSYSRISSDSCPSIYLPKFSLASLHVSPSSWWGRGMTFLCVYTLVLLRTGICCLSDWHLSELLLPPQKNLLPCVTYCVCDCLPSGLKESMISSVSMPSSAFLCLSTVPWLFSFTVGHKDVLVLYLWRVVGEFLMQMPWSFALLTWV